MLKGLRQQLEQGLILQLRLTGFPDVEGIETTRRTAAAWGRSLTGFPDVEGIETVLDDVLRGADQSDRLP